jgi:uncharacterized membrane protein (DUF485 family)
MGIKKTKRLQDLKKQKNNMYIAISVAVLVVAFLVFTIVTNLADSEEREARQAHTCSPTCSH